MSTPPSSTWDLSSSGADFNANVGLPSQTSSDDAARVIAAAMDNADPLSEAHSIAGSPSPAQLEEWYDDPSHEFRETLPGSVIAAAPDIAIPEEPNWEDDMANDIRATFPYGPQGHYKENGEMIDDDERVSDHPERRVAPTIAPPMPEIPGDPDLSYLDDGSGARDRVRAARRPSRTSSQTKRTAEESIDPITTPRRRT